MTESVLDVCLIIRLNQTVKEIFNGNGKEKFFLSIKVSTFKLNKNSAKKKTLKNKELKSIKNVLNNKSRIIVREFTKKFITQPVK